MKSAIRLSKDESFAILKRSFLQLCKDFDTDVSLKAAYLVSRNDWSGYFALGDTVSPHNYGSSEADSYSMDNQAVSFFKKAEYLPGFDTDKMNPTVEKFLQAEEQCKLFNEQLMSRASRNASISGHDFLGRARQRIAKLLYGYSPKDAINLPVKFTKGSSLHDKGDYISLPDKISSNTNMSELAYLPFCALINLDQNHRWKQQVVGEAFSGNNMFGQASCGYPPRGDYKPRLTFDNSNKFSTVPKTAKVDRAICIEPMWNVVLQRQVGRLFRNILKARTGIVIRKGTAKHVHNSRVLSGSVLKNVCTVDLQSASDTISKSLVQALFPPVWYDYMFRLRSPYTLMPDGTYIENEKFSSMGNGFTFEMQTIIFWAIAQSVSDVFPMPEKVSVFGDDIIADGRTFNTLTCTLEAFGLIVNREKSFSSGHFLESCGMDAFAGQAVRAYHLKKIPRNYYELYGVLNGLRLYAARLSGDLNYHCDPRVKNAWVRILRSIPRKHQYFGPLILGDQVILSDKDSVMSKPASCRGHIVTLKTQKRELSRYPEEVIMLAMFLGCSPRFSPRGASAFPKVRNKNIDHFWERFDYSFL